NIDEVLSLGVQRVILGSVAVKNPALVKEACQKYGDRVVVGIDAKDGIVAVDGWGVSGDVEVTVLAKEMAKAGVKTIIYTDISRDGTLSGVNVEATARLARESGIKVVASGGVKSLDDIKALLPYEKDGIEGVIVGKSIYTGSLDLQEAVALVESAGTGEA
ncbi:MAG: 1-(5-phosphoribosyl)-5-((5-phosphoribosylamino)methylideneamino)imidazole-4-carboxamide isomerase, partial [Selenomonadaceae bacterium]|nr:1-(5-phosphoribosyl)-5-((5-phosphoribosylamino)methylideneamino)imidazole-4-carboxamide isomerase [Selenomonadaceae bacterium]